ncbi:MAG TPA: UDP-N-acetylglucosamine--LPS N-acetylglucosamine transferase, partial [Coriobacteriia bacterium]|nr:UDP-N-acetylglucosamine--LPS N-acetylglucosamine transferase [Coriobacteriia bacterium]
MPSTGTIAVAYAGIGSGHRTCAEGIAAELAGRDDAPRVELLDILDYAKPQLSGNRLTSTFTGPTAGIYDAMWGSPAWGSLSRAVSGPLYDLMFAGFMRALDELQPKVVVCTHAAAAVMASRAKVRGRATWDVVNVTTDFGVHGYWPRDGVSLFCVADEISAEVLLQRGFEESTIAVTGIPVRRQFAVEYDKAASLDHFGLQPDKRTVLALAGASLPGPYKRFKESLAVALPAIASLPN